MEIAGPYGQFADGSEYALDGDWQYQFLRTRANSIEGGTTDILREHRGRARARAAEVAVGERRSRELRPDRRTADAAGRGAGLPRGAAQVRADPRAGRVRRRVRRGPVARDERPQLARADGLGAVRRPGARHGRAGRADGAARLRAGAGPDPLQHAGRDRARDRRHRRAEGALPGAARDRRAARHAGAVGRRRRLDAERRDARARVGERRLRPERREAVRARRRDARTSSSWARAATAGSSSSATRRACRSRRRRRSTPPASSTPSSSTA